MEDILINHEIKGALNTIYHFLRRHGKLISSIRIQNTNFHEEVIAFKDNDGKGAVYKLLYDSRTDTCISLTWEEAIVSIDNSSMYDDAMIGGNFTSRKEV